MVGHSGWQLQWYYWEEPIGNFYKAINNVSDLTMAANSIKT